MPKCKHAKCTLCNTKGNFYKFCDVCGKAFSVKKRSIPRNVRGKCPPLKRVKHRWLEKNKPSKAIISPKEKGKLTGRAWYSKVYLRSAEWKMLREKALEQQGTNCVICKSPYKIHVHHLTYHNPQPDDLVVLCERCHKECHKGEDGKKVPNEVVALTRRYKEYRALYKHT